MKIIGIVGSPRKKGNTEFLVRHALKVAEDAGCYTNIILLNEKNIFPCDGCWKCMKINGCHIQDDMQEINNELVQADGIILGSPCHVASVSAQCQAFMERTVYLSIRNSAGVKKSSKLRGKVGGSVTVGRRRGMSRTLWTLNGFFLLHYMVVTHGGVLGIARSFKKGGIKNEDPLSMEMAEEMVKDMVYYIQKLKV